MTDTVKFIFKTLIKIPIIIIVVYTLFNAFAFSLSYYKMLGLSYVALQTAVENNYIPSTERSSLEDYMQNTLETDILENVSFTPNTTFDKHQYGDTITVGVTAHYKFLWPLQPKEQHDGDLGVDGMNNAGQYQGDKSESELEDAREAYDSDENNITIEYTIPGLKYYPDME